MGCPLLMFRPLASMILGAIAFLAFFAYLLFNLSDGHLLSADFYAEALSENQVYDRVYDEVLVDPALQDDTKELLGNVEVPQDEMAAVARRVMPPAYLQAQTERTLGGLIRYLKKESDDPALYIDLALPLDNASVELVAYAEERIDRIEVVTDDEEGPSSPSEGPSRPSLSTPSPASGGLDTGEMIEQAMEQMQDFDAIQVRQVELETDEEWTNYWEDTVRELESGQLPTRIPALADVEVETRIDTYYSALDELRASEEVPLEVIEALEEPETDQAIRTALSNENPAEEEEVFKDVLKAATSGVIPNIVDDTLDDVRRELVMPDGTPCESLPQAADLSACTQYDVVASVFEDIEDNEEINSTRESIQLFGVLGSWLPRVVLIGACILIVLVNLPSVVSAIRWLGLVLGLTGVFFLIAGILVGGTIPDRLDSALQDLMKDADAPASIIAIVSDVTAHMADVLSLSLTSPSLIMLVVGVVFFGASLVIRRIPVVGRLPSIR